MDAIPLESSMFSFAEYDPRLHTLTLTFKNGHQESVPCDKGTYQEFLESKSKGSFWHTRLKTQNRS